MPPCAHPCIGTARSPATKGRREPAPCLLPVIRLPVSWLLACLAAPRQRPSAPAEARPPWAGAGRRASSSEGGPRSPVLRPNLPPRSPRPLNQIVGTVTEAPAFDGACDLANPDVSPPRSNSERRERSRRWLRGRGSDAYMPMREIRGGFAGKVRGGAGDGALE